MKSDKKLNKLTLSKHTLRSLTAADLDQVAGGTGFPSVQAPCGGNRQSDGGPFPNNRFCV